MRSLNLLVLRCRDIEASRAFYEVLGLRFTKHVHGAGPEHYAHEDDHGVLELYPAQPAGAGDMTGVGFGVSNLEQAHSDFLAASFAPAPIRDQPWGRSFIVRDPDGRRVEITRGE